MSQFSLIFLLACSLVLIFGAGKLAGKFLHLDKFLDEMNNKSHKLE